MRRRVFSLALIAYTVIGVQEASLAQVQDSLPHDSILCARYGGFVPKENRVFHSMMFDSLAAAQATGLESPSYVDLLNWVIMKRPEVLLHIKPYEDSYSAMVNDTNKQQFNSLNYYDLQDIYYGNLVVKAKVVAKNDLQPGNNFFKTTYLLEIREIYKTYWKNIKVGDTVVLKSPGGYEYARSNGEITNYKIRTTRYPDYEKGQTALFALTNADYHKHTFGSFTKGRWSVKGYEDFLCSGFFRAAPGNNHGFQDLSKADDIKEYINLYLRE